MYTKDKPNFPKGTRCKWNRRVHLLTALVMTLIGSALVGLNFYTNQRAGIMSTAVWYGFPEPFLLIDQGRMISIQYLFLSESLGVLIAAEWLTVVAFDSLFEDQRPTPPSDPVEDQRPAPPSDSKQEQAPPPATAP